MNKIAQFILKYLAKAVLRRYRPKIIGVSGSVGKTSTKEAVYTVLSSFYNVRATLKNYNNELGLPFSILAVRAPGKSIWAWIRVFRRFVKLIIVRDNRYPEILVLEMGVDRPGDMDYLLSIVSPSVAIITGVGESHLAFFGTTDKLRQEKQKLIEGVVRGGTAIVNYDNDGSRQMIQASRAKVLSYGLSEGADLWAQDIVFDQRGMHFKLNYQGSVIPVFLDEVFGYPAIYAALAALTTALSLEINLVDAILVIKGFRMPPGRLQLLAGINGSTIIDDTYNSAPSSALAALKLMTQIRGDYPRRIAVLGEMLELGEASIAGHLEVGRLAGQIGLAYLFLVGPLTKEIALGAQESGFPLDRIIWANTREELEPKLLSLITPGDLILVKASQGGRLEKTVKKILANPEQAAKLLVRQDASWDKI